MSLAAPTLVAPPATVSSLVALAEALTALLERETALVRAMEIAKIAPLQAEKTRLTQAFQKALGALGHGPGKLSLAGPAKTAWLVAGRRLAAAAAENERALRIGRTATERLIRVVVTAVRNSRRPPAAYSARRAAPCPARLAGIALDHRL
jgi:hypothetical protein